MIEFFNECRTNLSYKMKKSVTMKEIPSLERPYEKCKKHGVKVLSDAELLAIILRTGTKGENALQLAQRIIYSTSEEELIGLHEYSLEDFKKIKGIGNIKAIQLMCVLELSKRLGKAKTREKLTFTSPESIARYYMDDLRYEAQELVLLVMFNSKGGLIGEKIISKGTVNASLISPREILIEALKCQAVTFVVMHNHPSGDPTPSKEDIALTKRIREAGMIVGIELLDHIIIGNNCYISLNKEGYF